MQKLHPLGRPAAFCTRAEGMAVAQVRQRKRPMRRIAWALLWGLAACGPAPTPSAHQPLGGGTLTVAAAFDAALKRAGNTLTITVADADGAPVPGATVVVTAEMPSHGHEAVPPDVRAGSAGRYEAGPLAFPMAGRWNVRVHAVREAGEGEAVLEAVVP